MSAGQVALARPLRQDTDPGSRRRARRRRMRSVAVHAIAVAGAVVMLYPLLWLISSSIKPSALIFSDAGLWPHRIDLSGYNQGWSALPVTFGRFLLNSVLVTVLSVLGVLVSSSVTAFAFARLEFTGKKVLFAFMLATVMLPHHVTLVPQYILFNHFGWINTYVPLVAPSWLAVNSFFVFLIVQFIRGIPRELDEAAMLDGCGPLRLFLQIILPLTAPALVTTAILAFVWSWDEFLGPLIYLQDPQKFTVPLGLRMFLDATASSNWGGMFAMSVLALLPLFVVFLLFQRRIVEGVATSGLKG